jgi:hypothetical protein
VLHKAKKIEATKPLMVNSSFSFQAKK